MIKNIGIIGCGKLGLSFALLCAHRGFNVIGSDIRKDYIDSLNNRTYRTTEPLINEYLDTSGDRFLATTDNRKVIEHADIIFLFIPTPSLPSGEYDHQYIEQIWDELAGMDIESKIFVIGCTVMPGYTQSVIDRGILYGASIVYNPEFIAQGEIIKGLKTADMVLVGIGESIADDLLREIYYTIQDTPLNMKIMSPTAAEITKIATNCYLTMKISYANMIGEIAINSGIENEVDTILQAIGSDSRIGNKYLGYGFGYGGPCLPRDNKALGIYINNMNISRYIPLGIDLTNTEHNRFLKNYWMEKNPNKLPFIFNQIAYKKGTGMLVDSQQYKLACDLLDAGYIVYTTEDISGQNKIPLWTKGTLQGIVINY